MTTPSVISSRSTKDLDVFDALVANLSEEGSVQVSMPRLARLAGVGVATAARCVARLEAAGKIRVIRVTDPVLGSLPNTYTVDASAVAA